MAVCAVIITVPAYWPASNGVPVAFFAVVSIAVIGLYIAYVIPIYLRWRMGDTFETGPMDARAQVQVDEPVRHGLGRDHHDHLHPADEPRRRAVERRVRLEARQLRPAGDGRRDPRRRASGGSSARATPSPARATRSPRSTRSSASRTRAASSRRRPDSAVALQVIEPATEEVLAEVQRATAADVDAAVARAKAAFPAWRAVAPGDRARLLHRLADTLDEHHEELAVLEARNAGKPIGDARGEMGMVADTFRYYAGRARAPAGRHHPGGGRPGRSPCASRSAWSGSSCRGTSR